MLAKDRGQLIENQFVAGIQSSSVCSKEYGRKLELARRLPVVFRFPRIGVTTYFNAVADTAAVAAC